MSCLLTRMLPALLLLAAGLAQATDFWLDLGFGLESQADRQAPLEEEVALQQTASSRFNLEHSLGASSRLGVQYGLAQRWQVQPGTGAVATQSDASDSGGAAGMGAEYRWRDLPDTLYRTEADDFALAQNLDRLQLQQFSSRGELTVGRQAISFGLSQQFSPVDVIMPARISAHERSYRPGVDAVRWRQAWGAVGEVDLGWVQGDDQALFARGYQQVDRWTLEGTVLTINRTQYLAGVGAQTAVGNWGIWQETAWLFGEEDAGLRLTLGADRQVLGDVYLVTEYHYNQPGSRRLDPAVAAGEFYQQGMVVPLGRHYVSVQAAVPPTPLTDVRAGALVNLGDGSALLTAGYQYSLTNNSRLDAALGVPVAGSLGTGELPDQEFALYPLAAAVNWTGTW